MFFSRFLAALLLFFSLSSCVERKRNSGAPEAAAPSGGGYFTDILSTVLHNAELPENISQKIQEGIAENPAFILDLFACLQGDPFLRVLVDKEHPLGEDYAPLDLIELKDASRRGLMLRAAAAASLGEMAAAARAEGHTLTASSAYRSYEYQIQVYERNVREMGKEAADRESAAPGFSQHQLGLTVDFGPIDDSFARTRESRWLAANASLFGWSLSYPADLEAVTGYRWESWHYRYVGRELAEFIDNYFDGIQQYGLRFIHEWERTVTSPE
ncbi:MAG: M15 family metallopeptidase [Treponema sp.]|jgi:D-alanyl-D-alanine carboxypeptidase|nr:M15 family metallopeptidase [Treponema sp.]